MPPTSTTRARTTPQRRGACLASCNESRSLYRFSRFANRGCSIRDINTPRIDPDNRHTSPVPILRWVSARLVVEDLQNGRELES